VPGDDVPSIKAEAARLGLDLALARFSEKQALTEAQRARATCADLSAQLDSLRATVRHCGLGVCVSACAE
jgi:hypothetical protein